MLHWPTSSPLSGGAQAPTGGRVFGGVPGDALGSGDSCWGPSLVIELQRGNPVCSSSMTTRSGATRTASTHLRSSLSARPMFRNAFRNAFSMCVKHRDLYPQKARFPTREVSRDKHLVISQRVSATGRETLAWAAQDVRRPSAFA